jgi:hypothetical protein
MRWGSTTMRHDDAVWWCGRWYDVTIWDNDCGTTVWYNDVVGWLVRRCSTTMQRRCGTTMRYNNWYDSAVWQCDNMQHDNMRYDMRLNNTLHIMPYILPQISFLYRTFWYFGSLISLFCALHLMNYYIYISTSNYEPSRAESSRAW